MRSRPIVITMLVCLAALLVLPAAALAWSNGDEGGNGFGTHDWILREAARLAAERNAGLGHPQGRRTEDRRPRHRLPRHLLPRLRRMGLVDVWGRAEEGHARTTARRWPRARRATGPRPASTPVSWRTTTATSATRSTPTSRRRRPHALVVRDGGAGVHRRQGRELGLGRVRRLQGDGPTWSPSRRPPPSTSHKSYTALVKGYNSGGMNATVCRSPGRP